MGDEDGTPTPDPKIAELEASLATMRVSNARLQALSEFPLADKDLINTLIEPEQISAHAQRTHQAREAESQKVLTLQQELEALKQQRQGTGVTPTPPANSDAAATEAEAKYQRMARMVAHPSHRKQVDLIDAEIFQETAFKRAWNKHMSQRKEAGLRTQPVPES